MKRRKADMVGRRAKRRMTNKTVKESMKMNMKNQIMN